MTICVIQPLSVGYGASTGHVINRAVASHITRRSWCIQRSLLLVKLLLVRVCVVCVELMRNCVRSVACRAAATGKRRQKDQELTQ